MNNVRNAVCISIDVHHDYALAWVVLLIRVLKVKQDTSCSDCFNCILEGYSPGIEE